MSSFSWLDHSEDQRRKTFDVLALFRQQGTVDELGIGQIRDAFSDLLLPGISTIQTRARYFLFVPWIYMQIEGKRSRSHVDDTVRRLEGRLIRALVKGREGKGVIGSRAGENVQRLPSNVYWNGLSTFGIRLFPGSQDQLHQLLQSSNSGVGTLEADDPETRLSQSPHWHSDIPNPPAGWLDSSTHDLTHEEAEYLRDRIAACVGDSMLSWLVTRPKRLDADAIWDFREMADLPPERRVELSHARNFAVCIYGAQLVYNLLLAQEKANPEWEEKYRLALEDWSAEVDEDLAGFRAWDQTRFWGIVSDSSHRVHPRTRDFVTTWIKAVLDSPTKAASAPETLDLIRRRELALKGKRARFTNVRALELWQGGSGADQLDYRWGTARTIVHDIMRGLRRRDREEVVSAST